MCFRPFDWPTLRHVLVDALRWLFGCRPTPVIVLSELEFYILIERGEILYAAMKTDLVRRAIVYVDRPGFSTAFTIRLSTEMWAYLEEQTAIRGFSGLSEEFLELVETSHRVRRSADPAKC